MNLPACHFGTPDVELVRYAITVGLLTARTPEERYRAIQLQPEDCISVNEQVVWDRSLDLLLSLSVSKVKLLQQQHHVQDVTRCRSILTCRRKVVEAAAQRAQATAEWLDTHEFMPQAELSSWVDVVRPLPIGPCA